MKPQQTLKALYEFTATNYDSLKSDWNKLPSATKSKLPLTLFIIGVFGDLLESAARQEAAPVDADKNAQVGPIHP